ncbi:MAG: exodeoxyribonuclease V subunit gamma [Burkholderiaceae bacterium]|nr:exodeoxyribonuclease V subunit gamma [Burkholderiaceae bacterium]
MTIAEITPGLMLAHGNQPEALRDLAVIWMRRYPLAPLENDVVLVQSNGIAQWLKLALAADPDSPDGAGLGIAAALEFSLPSRFLWRAYRAVLGASAVPEQSPYDKPFLIWRLMRLLPQISTQDVYAPLTRFLQDDTDRRKRFQLAGRLADLFDQYQVYRADWLDAWASGDDIVIDARGGRKPLPDEQLWQAALWRVLLADVEGMRPLATDSGRAAVHANFMLSVNNWTEPHRPAGLPRRLVVFGISALPRQSLEVLAALSRWTQVLMCIHNPCQHYWADIVPDKDLLRSAQSRQQRRAGSPQELTEDQVASHAHPLLAAWGKQGRDFIGLLDEHDSDVSRAAYLPQFSAIQQRIDLFASPGQTTLLQQLQDDILDLRPVQETCQQWSAVNAQNDASIRFHIAHSPQREVEILHDQLLAAFNADVSLRPRDIIVMVPEIDSYSAHIQAVFGLHDVNDPRYIPYSVADQSQRRINPLISALEQLLGMTQSRFTVSNVLDLLDVPAVRQRFGIADTDMPLLHRWIRGANIRWGLHAQQRTSLDLPDYSLNAAQNTWLFGLRRMLLGYATGAGAQAWQSIQPYDEIGGLDAALLGPLLQFFERLDETWRSLSQPATVPVWCERLEKLLTDFFIDDDSDDAYTLQQLRDTLERWQDAANQAALTEELPLSVVREYCLAQLEDSHLSQRFFAGSVTFATLMPMRAIPFRQVCLLGMNDGDYPRTRVPVDFDLMSGDYRPGDRSRREDDRYLFLEALLSARERLHISWVGRSITDNTPRAPSVLVGQLRDHLVEGWTLDKTKTATPADLLSALTVEHPLQPFSVEYFPAKPSPLGMFTYAAEWRAHEVATATVGGAPTVTLSAVQRQEDMSLRELGDFLKQPVQAFFHQRLHVVFQPGQNLVEDHEPFGLDGLEKWRLQDELIQAQAAAIADGNDPVQARDACLAVIRGRGELAEGSFADLMAADITALMDELFQDYQAALQRWPIPGAIGQQVHYAYVAADGTPINVSDWITGLRGDAQGNRAIVRLETSNLTEGRHYRSDRLINHWVAHVAAQLDGQPLTTLVISKAGMVELSPLDAGTARDIFDTLLQAWHDGMQRPLPLAARTAFTWLRGGKDALGSAQAVYEGGYHQLGEVERSPYLLHCYPDFSALADSGEFAELAVRLLGPLHQASYAAGDQVKPAGKDRS